MTPVLAFCIGYFFHEGQGASWVDFSVGVISVFLIHSFATVRNDINDYEIDRMNSPRKPLSSGQIDFRTARNFSLILFFILLCIAILAFPIGSTFIILMVVLAALYNERPLFLSRKPFGSLIILALMYSSLPFLYGYCLTHSQLTLAVIITVVAWFILRLSISVLKDFKDAKGDALFNKKTFYLSFGKKATIIFSLIAGVIGIFGILYAATTIELSWWLVIALFLGIYNIWLRWRLFEADDKKLKSLFHAIFFGQNQFDLTYLLWILVK